jgi:hypothetical protein
MFISTTRKPTQPTAREGLQAPVGGHVGKATCLLPFPDPAVIEHTRTWQSLNLRTRPTQAVVTVPGCHRHGRAPPRRRRGRWRGQVRFLFLPSLGQRGPGKSARGPAGLPSAPDWAASWGQGPLEEAQRRRLLPVPARRHGLALQRAGRSPHHDAVPTRRGHRPSCELAPGRTLPGCARARKR